MVEGTLPESRIPPNEARLINTPERLGERTPAHLVGDLHAAFGCHHARAVHTKGTILVGTFTPSVEARALCRASLFAGTLPVIARFSSFTGLPDIPDTDPNGQPRGLAIKFLLADGSDYDVVNHSFNGFPTATATEFGELLLAIAASGPAKAGPTALDLFLASHPAARHFLSSQTGLPESFATTAYYGVNAFQFTSPDGAGSYVRYRFKPSGGERYLDPDMISQTSANYLGDEITQRLAQQPVEFCWSAQLAEPGDVIDDPSVAWPEERVEVPLGIVRLDGLASDPPRADRALLFLPGSTPPGIAIADPMLTVRNAAYPISYAERSAPR